MNYNPTPQAQPFHDSPARVRVLVGENRGGVTTAAAAEVARLALASQVQVAVVGENAHTMAEVQWRALELLLHNHIVQAEWADKARGIPSRVFLSSGSVLDFYSSHGEPPRGMRHDLLWMDQQPFDWTWYGYGRDACARFIWSIAESQQVFPFTMEGNPHLKPEDVRQYKEKLGWARIAQDTAEQTAKIEQAWVARKVVESAADVKQHAADTSRHTIVADVLTDSVAGDVYQYVCQRCKQKNVLNWPDGVKVLGIQCQTCGVPYRLALHAGAPQADAPTVQPVKEEPDAQA